MSNPTPLTTRLNELRAAIAGMGPDPTLAGLAQAVQSLLGLSGEEETSLAGLLKGITGASPASLFDLSLILASIKGPGSRSVADLLTEGYFANAYLDMLGEIGVMQERLDRIQAVLGAVPYESSEVQSVNSTLWELYRCCLAQTYGRQPATLGDHLSTGDAISSGRRYAVFAPPIDGVLVEPDGINLTADWSGWQAYIQTTDPAPQIAGASDVPNAWVDLVGTGTINFSVAGQYTITVHLRRPAGGYPYVVWSGPTVLTKTVNDGSEEFLSIVIPPGSRYVSYDVYATPPSLNVTVSQPGQVLLSASLSSRLTGYVQVPFESEPVTFYVSGFFPGTPNGSQVTIEGFVKAWDELPAE